MLGKSYHSPDELIVIFLSSRLKLPLIGSSQWLEKLGFLLSLPSAPAPIAFWMPLKKIENIKIGFADDDSNILDITSDIDDIIDAL